MTADAALPAYYGLFALQRRGQKRAGNIGIDIPGCLSPEHLIQVMPVSGNLCAACLGGGDPTEISQNGEKDRSEMKIKSRIIDKENET